MAESQTLDGIEDALDHANQDVAHQGEVNAKIAAQANFIAESLAGHDTKHDAKHTYHAPGTSSGSVGYSDSSFSIADCDDLTAMMLMTPKHHFAYMLKTQEMAVVLLDRETDKLYNDQQDIATSLQKITGGKRRMNDEQLNDIRYDKNAPDAAVRLSIDYHEKAVKIAKRMEVIERKKVLIEKLKGFLLGNRGIMKDDLNTALYNQLKAKGGVRSEETKIQRMWLLLDDDADTVPVASSVPAAASAATITVKQETSPSVYASKTPAVPMTKNGEPDKRFKYN